MKVNVRHLISLRPGRRGRWLSAAVVALTIVLGGVAAAATDEGQPVKYRAPGGNEVGLRPTGVGLPDIGESSTTGAGELVSALTKYHDSGEYESDLSSVDGAAQSYLDAHLGGHAKPAIVLDIDETSLSNYTGLVASGFTAAGTVAQAASRHGHGDRADARAVSRRDRTWRRRVLRHRPPLGDPGADRIKPEKRRLRRRLERADFKPTEADTEQFKSSTRAAIQKSGYHIVINVGDQQSDLDGGFAQRAFKLPNPFYFIPD